MAEIRPVAVPVRADPERELRVVAGRPVSIARQRFGRKFAHEPDSDFHRNPEPVLTRWQKKLPWQNVKCRPDCDDDYPPDGPKEIEE